MESEKVKEIKKALEYAIDMGLVIGKNTMFVNIKLADILTLINELESENEGLKWEKQTLEDKDTLLTKVGEVVQENQQLKDRIAELESDNKSLQDLCNKTYEDLTKEIDRLEKENKDYYDRLNNLQTYIDNHEEIWKGNTKIQLQQFAERLKEKAKNLKLGSVEVHNFLWLNDIDRTLKEFIKD